MSMSDEEKEKQCHYAVQGWKILTTLAKQQKENPGETILTLTYGQFGDKLTPKLHYRISSIALGPIQDYVQENGFPLLTSLVVRAGDDVPGEGYDGPTDDALLIHQKEACEHDWDKINPPPDFDAFMAAYNPNDS